MFLGKVRKLKKEHWKALFYMALSFFPGMILKIFRRDLWLVSELADSAHDNGYWFYRYVRENHKEIDICYAMDPSSPEYYKVASLGKTVPFGGFFHHIWTWACSKNIGTHVASGLPNASLCHRLFMCGAYRFKNIFLQHGIIHNKNAVFVRERTKIDCFICSCDREADFVSDVLGHRRENIYVTGLCRYDQLNDRFLEKNIVLIMPTWRMWLNDQTFDEFKQSEYYQQFLSLLQNEELHSFAEQKDLKIVFFLHSGMTHFLELFSTLSSRVVIANKDDFDVQFLLKQAAFLITDYSSVAFDFSYMKKPLAYFQFDQELFRNIHCEEGYFSYEDDGMGPVFESLGQLVSYLKDSWSETERSFLLEDRYRQRSDCFFKFKDQQNCERVFDVINRL